jgi:hypothetical protein
MTALSVLWPTTFPAHRNGAAAYAHDAHWTHFPSVDHRDPAALGGAHDEDNLVTTSMARNQVRSRYSLQELGFQELSRPARDEWDGGASLLLNLVAKYPHLLDDAIWGPYLTRWVSALRQVLAEYGSLGETQPTVGRGSRHLTNAIPIPS